MIRIKIRLNHIQAEGRVLRFDETTTSWAHLIQQVARKLDERKHPPGTTYRLLLQGDCVLEEINEINDDDDLVWSKSKATEHSNDVAY